MPVKEKFSGVNYRFTRNASYSETIKLRNEYSSPPINKINEEKREKRERDGGGGRVEERKKPFEEPEKSIISLILNAICAVTSSHLLNVSENAP